MQKTGSDVFGKKPENIVMKKMAGTGVSAIFVPWGQENPFPRSGGSNHPLGTGKSGVLLVGVSFPEQG